MKDNGYKRRKYVMLVICFIIICSALYREEIIKNYPLSAESIQEAINNCQFPTYMWVEENEVSDPLTQSLFSIRCPDDELSSRLCMGILTRKTEEFCSLGLTVLSIDGTEELSEKEIKQSIWLATHLFWNGKNSIKIINKFFKVFSADEDYNWKEKIDGVDCEIIYRPEDEDKLSIRFFCETKKEDT